MLVHALRCSNGLSGVSGQTECSCIVSSEVVHFSDSYVNMQ